LQDIVPGIFKTGTTVRTIFQEMSDPESVATSITAEHQMAQQLTESILTLQQTIKNVQEDVHNGIAPSILLPVNPVS
jgi:hypothetical protein